MYIEFGMKGLLVLKSHEATNQTSGFIVKHIPYVTPNGGYRFRISNELLVQTPTVWRQYTNGADSHAYSIRANALFCTSVAIKIDAKIQFNVTKRLN
jgi:hypothetical protein